MTGSSLIAALLLAASPAANGPHYGPEQPMRGQLASGFEMSRFNGCWFELSAGAYRDFSRLVGGARIGGPQGSRYALQIVGRQTLPTESNRRPGLGYGHLNMAPCQIQAVRVLSARRLP